MLTFACIAHALTLNAAAILPGPMPVNAVRSGKTAVLAALTKNIEYDNASAGLRESYYTNLDKLAKTIADENYAVSLRGHADGVGGYKYNWVLSDHRAIGVKEYLVSKGVSPDNIVTTPYGSTLPVATNKTAAGRQKNRRVEIVLKKISK